MTSTSGMSARLFKYGGCGIIFVFCWFVFFNKLSWRRIDTLFYKLHENVELLVLARIVLAMPIELWHCTTIMIFCSYIVIIINNTFQYVRCCDFIYKVSNVVYLYGCAVPALWMIGLYLFPSSPFQSICKSNKLYAIFKLWDLYHHWYKCWHHLPTSLYKQ